jgi:hypothetical protein
VAEPPDSQAIRITARHDPALSLVFGIGKWICLGHFVDTEIFNVASSSLSVFKEIKEKDENGNENTITGPRCDC